ncbi:MAG TPA: NAD(P)H-hydrate dehydratase [Acidimicrobiales bacterium]|nr:NAD(P)H-hydrate dehydratase [Acidimicrobiales bacterium]
MQPVLTVAEMQAVDREAQATTPLEALVGRAGQAVAGVALEMLGGAYGRRVWVVAGKGNNGADGRVAAATLSRRGARVTVGEPGTEVAGEWDLVIDAAYGTGFRGEYQAPAVPTGTPVLAVDIPSGVLGDTGEASGRPLRADRTITFAALKPGLLQGDGVELAGRVTVADIGLPVGTPELQLMEDADVLALLPSRRRNDHKWSSAVLIVAGSPGMTGAAGLCARGAMRTGAGMIRLGVPGGEVADSPAPEAVSVALPRRGWSEAALEASRRCAAIVVGPGLGRDPETGEEVRRLLRETGIPVVVDADGLFALGLLDDVKPIETRAPVVLTPHDGEYRQLMGAVPGGDRLEAARRLARAAGGVALVKGSTTAVAEPSGRARVSMSGSPRLATAGTGDVLSGVIGALLARGVPPLEAAALGAHLHGRAADRGPAQGLIAGDLPPLISLVLSDLVPDHPKPPRDHG